jgi:hypothetical protein
MTREPRDSKHTPVHTKAAPTPRKPRDTEGADQHRPDRVDRKQLTTGVTRRR